MGSRYLHVSLKCLLNRLRLYKAALKSNLNGEEHNHDTVIIIIMIAIRLYQSYSETQTYIIFLQEFAYYNILPDVGKTSAIMHLQGVKIVMHRSCACSLPKSNTLTKFSLLTTNF